jgi:hypothetical protein
MGRNCLAVQTNLLCCFGPENRADGFPESAPPEERVPLSKGNETMHC